MPQIFQVLKCYKCSIFQVHLTKKSNKWECKLCGEKQSIKRHYGIGTAVECRGHVQKLNALQGDKDEVITTIKKLENEYVQNNDSEYTRKEIKQSNIKRKSKWSAFLDENDDSTPDAGELNNNKSDIPIQVLKKQKILCEKDKKDIYEDEQTPQNILSTNKLNDKIYQSQELKMRSNKWFPFMSDNENAGSSNKSGMTHFLETRQKEYINHVTQELQLPDSKQKNNMFISNNL